MSCSFVVVDVFVGCFFFLRCFTLSGVLNFPSSVARLVTATIRCRSIWIPYKRWTVRRTNHQLLAHPQVYNIVVFCEATSKISKNSIKMFKLVSSRKKYQNSNKSRSVKIITNCVKIGKTNLVRYRLCFGRCQRCSRIACWTCTSCGCSRCRCTQRASSCCEPLIIVSPSLFFHLS